MTDEQENGYTGDTEQKEGGEKDSREVGPGPDDIEVLKKSLEEANDKYIRLYADFENYKKIAARNKEELLKYANEDLMTDILTVIDHLELALQHSEGNEASSSLAEGVELTLKELRNVLEKHGLVKIEALDKPFDPTVHHAMSQIETEDKDENTVVKEFRKGYTLKERVLRAALVGVAVKPAKPGDGGSENAQDEPVATDENKE